MIIVYYAAGNNISTTKRKMQ